MSLELFMNDVITVQQPRMKTCSKCKTPKPATTEYFYRMTQSGDGFRSDCKECSSVGSADYYYNKGGQEYQRAYRQNGGYERQKKNFHENTPHRTAFSHLRSKVKRRGKRKFLLGEAKTPEAEAYIKYLQTITHCPDCSKELVWYSEGGKKFESASFDRIDSDEHYTKENVRIVCSQCNSQKNDLPVDEWVALLEKRVEKGIIEDVDSRLIEFLCE